ncbi:hypothetical protein BGX26_010021 [Mortierella sp. AD094]|nr:hypothetical protein BGX26_010021 [Mortierella sp. AD094]
MSNETLKPKVLIVGAGIGGLSLTAILERAGDPYEIFEKERVLKPLGCAINLGPGVMPMLVQLGIIDEIIAKSKVAKVGLLSNEKMELLTSFDYYDGMVERFGWST